MPRRMPSPSNFSSFHYDSRATATSTNTGASSSYSVNSINTAYNGMFTLTRDTPYTLRIDGTTSSSNLAVGSNMDFGQAYGYLSGPNLPQITFEQTTSDNTNVDSTVPVRRIT